MINLGAPEITLLVLQAIGLGISLARHGEPKTGTNNVYIDMIALSISQALLIWGGFYA